MSSFMPPAWKVRQASSNQIVCLSVIPSRLQSAMFKVKLMMKQPNLDRKFIYGFLTLHWHHMPLGVGRGQNVGLRNFCHILTLLSPWASVFYKHMSILWSFNEYPVLTETCLLRIPIYSGSQWLTFCAINTTNRSIYYTLSYPLFSPENNP